MCLAHGLKRAGTSASVYERNRTRSDGLNGYRVGIDPTSNRALRECLCKTRSRDVPRHCARAPEYLSVLSEKMRFTASVPLRDDIRSHRERATRRSC